MGMPFSIHHVRRILFFSFLSGPCSSSLTFPYRPSVGGVDGCDFEFDLIQHRLPRTHIAQSQTQGLSLNIVLPQMDDLHKILPVLVFLHGGGFSAGSSSWPQNQLTKLVSLSQKLGLPTVGVSIKYVSVNCSINGEGLLLIPSVIGLAPLVF